MREAPATARVHATIRAGDAHLRRMGLARLRIAMAGINPHCGESGLFGTETTRGAPNLARGRRHHT